MTKTCGVNCKRLGITTAAVFVANILTNFIIHQVILKEAYQATSSLWRPEGEMQSFMPHMFGGQFLVSLFFSWIFVHGYKGTGIMEGVRFGLLMGGLGMGNNLIMHAVTPYTCALTCSWVVLGFAQGIILGVVASLVYKA